MKVRYYPSYRTKRFILMKHQTNKPKWILKLLQIIPRNCWINCKSRSIRRGKKSCRNSWTKWPTWKNSGKLTIYFYLNKILWAFWWSTLLVSICYGRINKSVSIFHTQFVLHLLFFFKQFQFHCFYRVFSNTKVKV